MNSDAQLVANFWFVITDQRSSHAGLAVMICATLVNTHTDSC